MKLRELVTLRESTLHTMTHKEARQTIEDITTHNHDYDHQSINQAVDVLMQDPKLVYRGPMYRVIFIDQQEILDREWFSWTRSLRDVQGFTVEAFQDIHPDDNQIGVIFSANEGLG